MSEIANHNIDEYGAPPFMYVMLVPHVPYTVIGRLLEINHKAADYEDDFMSCMNIVRQFSSKSAALGFISIKRPTIV